ncbi:MAG: DUF177 domain-containing protein [Pseudomonadota bacterium]
MPEHAADAPEFSRPYRVARLSPARAVEIDETPSAAEAARVAALLDLLFLSKLRLRGTLRPLGEGWVFDGTLGATVTQASVQSLEPVKTRIDTDLRRVWLPPTESATLETVEVDPDALDEIEPLGDTIDLGLLAVEELALALPSYPRAEGEAPLAVSARPPGAAPLEPRPNPFAALAGLREKMRGSDG